MAFLYYDTVVTGLVSQIDTLMVSFVKNGYNALASALKKPLGATGVLSIVLMGYGVMLGYIKAPMKMVYQWIIRLGIIFFLAMNWGNFSFYVVGLFDKAASELSQVVMNATHTPVTGKSMSSGMQTAFTNVINVGLWTIKKASIKNWSPAVCAFFIWISGILVIGVALCELIVAKIMLSVCLIAAPLFISLILFDQTKSFFDRWLGSIVGFSLVFIFVAIVVSLSLTLIHSTISGYLITQAENMESVGFIPIFLVACITTAILLKAAMVAKHIGGACHTASGTATAAGVAATAATSILTINQGLKAMNNFRQTHLMGLGNKASNSANSNPLKDAQYTTRGEL